jgi:drug/metabolite transporter (DMT)-like permease
VTYQRILPGFAVALGWMLLDRFTAARPATETVHTFQRTWPWVLINALAGPTLGVACYQWATKVADTSLVLSVTAMTPLCVIPLAYLADGERPTRRSILGGMVAVSGVVLLARARG